MDSRRIFTVGACGFRPVAEIIEEVREGAVGDRNGS